MREEPREERAPVKDHGAILLLTGCALLAACGRPAPSHAPAAAAQAPAVAYLAPPQLVQATRRPGAVILVGTAAPNAAIRLASPDGTALTASADRTGAFRITAPAGARPRLYSLSEVASGRLARAVGYIAALPAPGPPAALLRPAASATLAIAAAPPGIEAVDYDASGAARASGHAAPGETVRLYLDGGDAGEDAADAAGAFSASLSQTLKPGPHQLNLAGQRLRAGAVFTASRPGRLATPPFDAERTDGAWRIDWVTPGGGVQSTVLFDQKAGR
jgi:hypothetical protein